MAYLTYKLIYNHRKHGPSPCGHEVYSLVKKAYFNLSFEPRRLYQIISSQYFEIDCSGTITYKLNDTSFKKMLMGDLVIGKTYIVEERVFINYGGPLEGGGRQIEPNDHLMYKEHVEKYKDVEIVDDFVNPQAKIIDIYHDVGIYQGCKIGWHDILYHTFMIPDTMITFTVSDYISRKKVPWSCTNFYVYRFYEEETEFFDPLLK